MSNMYSSKGKYILAALVGAAAGGLVGALSTHAIPKMMSEMENKCKQMMAGMTDCKGNVKDACREKMTEQKTGSLS